jgi:hypothetical protein
MAPCTWVIVHFSSPTAIVWMTHVLKMWSPACDATGKWWNLLDVWPNGRKLGHWRCALEGDPGTLDPPLSCLLPGCHEVATSSTTCSPWHGLSIGPEAMGQPTLDWSLPNWEPKQSFPLFKLIILIFLNDRKLNNTLFPLPFLFSCY